MKNLPEHTVLLEELGARKPLKDLRFHGKFIQLVLDGDKLMTIRKYDQKYFLRKGEVVNGKFLTFPLHTTIPLLITHDIEILPLIGFTTQLAEEHGDSSVSNLIESLDEYYNDLEPSTPMVVIRFRLL